MIRRTVLYNPIFLKNTVRLLELAPTRWTLQAVTPAPSLLNWKAHEARKRLVYKG